MYDSVEFSKKMLKDINHGISNLKLQKLMYFVYGTYYCVTKEEILKEKPQAWDYGPVFPKVYYKYRKYGIYDIDTRYIDSEIDIKEDNTLKEIVEEVISQLASKKDYELIGKTHLHDTAWSKVYEPGKRGIILNLKHIEEEFQKYVK